MCRLRMHDCRQAGIRRCLREKNWNAEKFGTVNFLVSVSCRQLGRLLYWTACPLCYIGESVFRYQEWTFSVSYTNQSQPVLTARVVVLNVFTCVQLFNALTISRYFEPKSRNFQEAINLMAKSPCPAGVEAGFIDINACLKFQWQTQSTFIMPVVVVHRTAR